MKSVNTVKGDSLLAPYRLKEMRALHQVSRPVMAEILGVPHTSLKNWELGYRSLPLYLAVKIANAFGLPWATYLLGGEQPEVDGVVEQVGGKYMLVGVRGCQ